MTQDGFKDLHLKIDDKDILIRMQPLMDHQNNWTGDVNLQVIDSIANTLSDRDFADIMFFARMCLIGIDLLRSDEEVSRKVYQIAKKELEQESQKKQDSLSDKPYMPVTSRQGNIIKVDFKSIKDKLNGSA